jgi:hypothetical protein
MSDYREIEGNYYYGPHRRSWGVWRVGKLVNGCRTNEFICDFDTRVQAIIFCKKMNKNNQ